MSDLALNLKIEGDFIDSFIYSGVLYILDTEYNFSSYFWADICQYIKQRNNRRNTLDQNLYYYLTDNTAFTRRNLNVDTELNLTELNKLRKDIININCWPSDICIYSNKLYYAGDDGVYFIDTDYQTAEFKKDKKLNKIFGTKSFAISPANYHRVALAAGIQGVYTTCFYNNKNNPEEKKISNESSIDIEWMNNELFINSKNFCINKFQEILKKSEIEENPQLSNIREELSKKSRLGNLPDTGISTKSYFDYVRSVLRATPEHIDLSSNYVYGWSSGDVNYFLRNNNSITAKDNNRQSSLEIPIGDYNLNILRARTSGCGTILENNDGKLFLLTKGKIEEISHDSVSWRVYPRARNHSNHLHVINDDDLTVKIYHRSNESSYFHSFLSKNKN